MIKFSDVENCVPALLPFELPCWIWIFILWALAFAIFLDLLVYWFYPKFIKPRIFPEKKKRNTSARKENITAPSKNQLAHQMSLEIQEFREKLISIKTDSGSAQKRKVSRARNILNGIIQDKLPQANATFVYHEQVEKKLKDLEVKYQDYRGAINTLGKGLDDLSIRRNFWGSLGDKNSIESQMLEVVSELIALFNKEQRNESENENRQPKLILTPIVEPKKPTSSFPFQKLQNAILKVENAENYPITKCYARLINATYLHGSSMVSKDYGQERFKWMETKESNDLCEIEIPRKDFKRIDVGYGDMSFRFSFCEEDKKHGILGHRLYAVRIRVDGDGIEPVFFDGYVFVYQEVFYYKKTEMIDGKETKPETFEEYSPRMIFKAGDWRQDEVVQEYLKKWNEAYQEFRNE